MNTISHIRMSLLIKEAVERKLDIKLDTAGFMFGNIKPDYSSYFVTIPHFKDNAMDFVTSEINNLMQCRIKKHGRCTKKFSERLGVITHYLSDFFCYAHSNEFGGNLLKHYIYESELSKYSKMNLKELRLFSYSRYLSCNTDYKPICNSINELYGKYELKKPSYARDLIYALRICISLSISIIANCMSEEIKMAACQYRRIPTFAKQQTVLDPI